MYKKPTAILVASCVKFSMFGGKKKLAVGWIGVT